MAPKGTEKPKDDDKSGHGAFSSCTCTRCMTDAKNEVEKGLKFTEETWTANYINKLQAKVERLELENTSLNKRRRRYSCSTVSDISSDDDDDHHSFLDFRPNGAKDAEKPEAEETREESSEPKVEIKRRRKIQQKYGEHKVERDDDPGTGNFGAQSYADENVLTVTREFDRKKHFWRRSVDIVSAAFIQMLHQESPHDVDLHLVDGVLCLHDPLMGLFHNRKVMNRYIEKGGYASDSEETKQARAHTKLILDFMRKELHESRILDDLESSHPPGLIEFPYIWLLYPPGSIVYTKENGEYEAFVVDSVEGVQKSLRHTSGIHTYTRLELTCWSINYDGEVFGRVWTTHEIFPFKGPKEITSLNLVPERFVPDVGNVHLNLRARGQRFWDLQGQHYREFTGEIWSQHMSEESTRVMIDRLTHQRRHNWPISINQKSGPATAISKNWRDDRHNNYRHHPQPPPPQRLYDEWGYERRGKPQPRRTRQYANQLMRNQDEGPDDYCNEDQSYEGLYTRYDCDRPPIRTESKFKQYDLLQPDSQPDSLTLLLCPQQVHGYCFRDKIWKSLNITQLTPVSFKKNAWDRIVLDEEYKDIVQAMVASYVDKKATLEDLIAGKGAGLVALLHGPPGTGKTLTAECVAESFEKPLYQITSGDIGTDPSQLEYKLDEIFEYTTNWGAILLLDEADVFLQERDYLHLERNALVSSKYPNCPPARNDTANK